MRRIVRLENAIRDYAWGSRTAIAGLLGEPAHASGPQAELWMGAHPAAPSRVAVDGRLASLAELVAEAPAAILGLRVVASFGPPPSRAAPRRASEPHGSAPDLAYPRGSLNRGCAVSPVRVTPRVPVDQVVEGLGRMGDRCVVDRNTR
jgi:hypothetical protein